MIPTNDNTPPTPVSCPSREGGHTPRTAAIQEQIDDTVVVMRENITRMAQRGERLEVLESRTGKCAFFSFFFASYSRYFYVESLAVSARGFRRSANRVQKVRATIPQHPACSRITLNSHRTCGGKI